MPNRTDRLLDRTQAIVGPARWVAVAICTALLIGLAVAGGWPYALFGGFAVAGLVIKIRRQDRAHDQLVRARDS